MDDDIAIEISKSLKNINSNLCDLIEVMKAVCEKLHYISIEISEIKT